MLKLDFIGAAPNVWPIGQEPTEAIVSHFKGQPDQWKTGLTTCARLIYPDAIAVDGTGTVRASATDFGIAEELFRFGQFQTTLPTSFTFCWPELHPDGYGFEIIVQSMGGDASVTRITIEYLGPQC